LPLSEVEECIRHLISEGLTIRKVSEKLELADKVVEDHVTNILKKINAGNPIATAPVAKQIWDEFESSVKLH
jgi:DNA-binding NarL/FixJ family response regulator